MPYRVTWTGNASQGLERVYLFLAEKSEEAAVAALRAIREKALLLAQFPGAGRPAEDMEPEQRELHIPFGGAGYVLLYRFAESGGTVTVLAIRHQRETGW